MSRHPLHFGREVWLAAEMLRVLGAAVGQPSRPTMLPATAATIIRQSVDELSCGLANASDGQELRRRAERLAMAIFFSTWFGVLLEAIEMEDGRQLYRVKLGHCGDSGCCGPHPLLPGDD